MGEKTITYEMLYDILRAEKNSSRLQTLPDSFYSECRNYFLEKLDLLKKPDNKFAKKNLILTQKQIENIKKLLEDLHDLRTKKLLLLAQDKMKIEGFIVDYSVMLPNEKTFFDKISELLENNKKEILDFVFSEDSNDTVQEKSEKKAETEANIEEKTNSEAVDEKEVIKSKKVKFLQPVAKFFDADLNPYGPFEEGSIAELPEQIVKILLNKGAAEVLKE